MRVKNLKIIAVVLSVLLMASVMSCVDRFTPEIEGFKRVLIVDGILTDQQEAQQIRLSRSPDQFNHDLLPEVGAKVSIIDDQGVTYEYQEIEEGVYASRDIGFAKPGKSYQLLITTSDGKNYESKAQEMLSSKPISRVYAQIETQYFYDDQKDIPGYRFYVDGPAEIEEDTYLLWLESATYKYEADYPIDFAWYGRLTEFTNRDSLKTCYKDADIRSISTFSSEELSGSGAEGIKLNFERADLLTLSNRYSLLVNQYSISREAYEFWNSAEQQLGNDADLYTTQPYAITGNMSSVNDEEETVLGYFTVAGVSQDRIFVDAPDVEIPDVAPCEFDYMAYGYIFIYGPQQWPIYVANGPEGLALLGPGCLDCQELGGVLDVPEFWQE